MIKMVTIEIDGTLYSVKKDCLGEEEMKDLLMNIKTFIWENIGDYDGDIPEFVFELLKMLSVEITPLEEMPVFLNFQRI